MPEDKCNHLFDLECFLVVEDIRLCARSEIGRRQILALVTGSNELVLYYTVLGQPLPVVKQIPWLLDQNKKIIALCFDPSGTWLLVAGCDGSLFVVPALSLVDPSAALDHRWRAGDVTELPCGNSSRPSPSALAWWHNLDGQHVAILGSAQGHICFISLTSGADLGRSNVPEPILELDICQDNNLDAVFLLITSPDRQQWKLTLEQRSAGYCWPLERSALDMGLDADSLPGTCLVPLPARSRLQGLKQLSVEKLANLKQKLAETRKSGSLLRKDSSAEELGNLRHSRSGSAVHDNSISEDPPGPEKVASELGFFTPQYARGRYLLSGFYPNTQLLKILPMSVTGEPLFVHKLPPKSGCQLYTDRFLFVWDPDEPKSLTIVSCQLSEIRPDRDKEYNMDSVIQLLKLGPEEQVLAVYKRTESNYYTPDVPRSNESRDGRRLQSVIAVPSVPDLPQTVRDLKIDMPQVDTCVVVTNKAAYQLTLRQSPAELFMELALEKEELEKAERLALLFGLNVKQLLEAAGDLKLAARSFPQAIMLYRLSRCRHLKSVLKFAASGHSAELLSFVEVLLTATDVELSVGEKMHLSNLAVMSYVEQVLRANLKPSQLKKFLNLLRENLHYDEVLAVSVAGQTGLWDVLSFLATERGLHPEVLDVLLKLLPGDQGQHRRSSPHKLTPNINTLDSGLWQCLSDPNFLQSLLLKPKSAKAHLLFVSRVVANLEPHILQRLARLYNPSSPIVRMQLRKVFSKRQRLYSGNSQGGAFSHLESLDYSEPEENPIPVNELVETFILVLLQLTKKETTAPSYMPQLMHNSKLPSSEQDEGEVGVPLVALEKTPLCAGFSHAAVIRNGSLITWGSTTLGRLGNGPNMSYYGTPQIINFFPNLKIEVLTVSCGKNHTLALTNNGVYSWGSSQFGQLGLGKTGQSPHPRLVERLADEKIASISAGQYHSLALTEDGRVFSWGWGVHGQLGHGSVEDEIYPRLIQKLCDKRVVQVCGGHGHSTVLTSAGEVWGFGSGVFGQLGTSLVTKKTIPILVSLPEHIRLIATSYFHNMAVGESNNMYTWGSSYQVLRLQAQAQKRARLLHEQQLARPQTLAKVSNDGKEAVLSPDSPIGPPNPPHTSPSSSGTIPVSRAVPIPVSVENITSPVIEIPPGFQNVPVGNKSGIDTAQQLQSIEESIGQQTLFAPLRVDTSQVQGKIAQVWGGYHHSCLVTEGGLLYTWGRNLDGQLGNGSRKEVPFPTPLAPLADRQIVHAACGAEFTIAVDKSGTIFVWGSNALGQLGTIPQDESKTLEAKYVKLKANKRIIRLPHGKQNSSDLPCELPGVPSPSIPFSTLSNNNKTSMGFSRPPSMFPLERLEHPPFGPRTLHTTLETFHGHYDHTKALQMCLDIENYQAAAKLCSLERHYHLALAYQLKALSLGCSYPSSSSSLVSSPEYPSSPEKPAQNKPEQTEIHCFAIQGGQEQMIERLPDGEETPVECPQEVPCSPSPQENGGEKAQEETGETKQRDFAVEASSIVEHYVSLMEADSHTMMRRLLEQGIEFWLSHSLPVDQLEQLLMKHMSKFFYPLGLMLFCKGNGVEGEEQQAMQILSHLSTRFCLQLCKTLLSHINQKKAYPEYVELLAQVTSAHCGGASPPTNTQNGQHPSSLSPERLMEGVLENLSSSAATPAFITLHEVDSSSSGTEDFVFSCGHQYEAESFRRSVLPELELGLLRLHRPLPTTARVLKGLFGDGPSVKLACPLCVLRHLQAQQSEQVSNDNK